MNVCEYIFALCIENKCLYEWVNEVSHINCFECSGRAEKCYINPIHLPNVIIFIGFIGIGSADGNVTQLVIRQIPEAGKSRSTEMFSFTFGTMVYVSPLNQPCISFKVAVKLIFTC